MTTITPNGRALAIVAGAAFVYGGLLVILGKEALLDPSQWDTSVQVTVLTVFGVIGAGHLCENARKAKRWLAMAGFAAVFGGGTWLVIENSVGKQAETSLLTASQADDAAERRVALKASLARAEAMLSQAQAELARECKTGKGKRCDGIQATIGVYEAAVKGHVADLDKIGPQKPVNTKASEMAKIAALFGFNEAKAKALLMVLGPLLRTLFFELGAIVSLGFAFRSITESAPGKISDAEIEEFKRVTSNDTEPLPPTKMIEPKKAGADVVIWAKQFARDNGRKPRLDETEKAFKKEIADKDIPLSRSTCYRALREAFEKAA